MSESVVKFSITIDENYIMKIDFDGANKEKINKFDEKSQKLSPCPSLQSLNTTNDSEVLVAGIRRRAPSISSESFITSDSASLFDNDNLLRTSTPLPYDDADNLSDASFTSCVSRISEMSIVTNSSQETVTSSVANRESMKRGNSEKLERGRRKSVSYEEKNKERYGGWVEGNWRSALKKPQEIHFTSPKSFKTTISSSVSSVKKTIVGSAFNYGSTTSSGSKSRIPSLMHRPAYNSPSPPRSLPSVRVNTITGSYASAASLSSNRSSHFSQPSQSRTVGVKQTVQMTITTDSDGKMKIHFSNENSMESWLIDGIIGNSNRIDVRQLFADNN